MSFPVLTCHLGIFGEVSVKIFGAFFIRLFGHTAWHVSLDQDPSRPGIRPRPSALEVWGLNRWAARGALSLGLFVFLPLSFKGCSFVLDNGPSLYVSFANIYSRSLSCLHSLDTLFHRVKVLYFDEAQQLVSSFFDGSCLWCCARHITEPTVI